MDKEIYYDIIEKINDCLDYYENKDLEYTKFFLELANGDQFSIKFEPNNIPHLLGINIDYLRSTGMFTGNAYDIIDEITRSPKKLLNMIEQGHVKYENVFSDHITEKLNNFRNICGIDIRDIEFIVKYEKDKNLRTDSPLYDGYYIGYINGNELSVIGFEKNDRFNTYNPHTNLLFEQYTEESNNFLKRLCNNQTLTIVDRMKKNRLNEDDTIDRQNFYYKNYDKLNRLKNCKRYAETYNGVVDTVNSNLFYVEKVINLNEEKRNTSDILTEISTKIRNKKIIDLHTLKAKYDYVDDSIIEIVSAHNDSLINSTESDEEYSYKDIIEKYEQCKTEVIKLNNLIEKTDENTRKLTEENTKLKQENQTLNDEREQIKKILNR